MSLRTIATAAAIAVAVAVLGPIPAANADVANAPRAFALYKTTPYNTPVSGNLCTGATDPQGDAIKVGPVDGGGGTFTVDTNTCAYTWQAPAGGWGWYLAKFKLTDGTNVSDWIELYVTVGKQGDLPVDAQPDSFTTNKNLGLHLPNLYGQLGANDTDPEGEPVQVQDAMSPIGGYLPGEKFGGAPNLSATSLVYYPPTNFVGTRRFQYTATDGANFSKQSYTITVADNGPLKAPVANPDTYTVPKNGSITLTQANSLFANDSDADSAYIRIPYSLTPDHGTITNYDPYKGTFTYTPDVGFAGTDTFDYKLNDTEGNESAWVNVTMTVSTIAPTAVNDSYQVAQDKQLVVAAAQGLMANDTDPDSSFTVSSVLPPGHGTVSATHATGAFVYTPTAGWSGTDTFGYRLIDADNNYSTWATVTVKVVPPGVNEPPVVHDDTYQVHEGASLVVPAASGVLANDSDLEGEDLDVVTHTDPAHGSLSSFDPETGAFTYESASGWRGTETITYKAVDAQGAQSVLGTVTFVVINDAPTATDDSYTTTSIAQLVVPKASGLLMNDSDPEGDNLVVASWTAPTHGVIDVNDDGSFTYSPDLYYTGTDTFTYQIRDVVQQVSDFATVTITVDQGILTSSTPTITGTPRVGRTLTAVAGTWSPGPVLLAYQWLRNGAPIAGATKTTYVLTAADLGRQVSVRVTGSRAGLSDKTRTSAATTVAAGVLVAPRPAILGIMKVGRTVRVSTGTWGPGVVTKRYRWYRNGVAIRGAVYGKYRLTKKDKGKRITVRVTGSKAGFTTVTRASLYRIAR